MKVIVTGGAGYKGTVLTKRLLDAGYDVTLLDNFMYGYEPVMHLATNKKLNIVRHDIRNGIPGMKDYDVIFHLAGISGFPACASNPHSAQLINVEAVRQIANDLAPPRLILSAPMPRPSMRQSRSCMTSPTSSRCASPQCSDSVPACAWT